MTSIRFNSRPRFFLLVATGILSVFSSLAGNDIPKKNMLTEQQRSVIAYFQEVALGFEFGNTTPVTRKWVTDMKVFVAGDACPEALAELDRIIEEVNDLVNDFKITIVSEQEDANMFLFFGSKSAYGALYPKEAPLLKGSSGLCTISWNNKNQIIRGHIFVKNEGISLTEQRHVIREELTQALGFGKDSPRYMDSVFQSRYTTPTEYSPIDRQLISLLYNTNMHAGLAANETEQVLAKIMLAVLN